LRTTTSLKKTQSVSRAVTLLRALSGGKKLSISELAQSTGLNVSTAHHLVQTLVAEHFVGQDDATKRYMLGPALLTIISPTDRIVMLTRILHEPMSACAVSTGLDVWAAVLQDDRVHYIARVPARHPERIEVPLLSSHPAFCVACGRVLLSSLDRPAALEILSHHPIKSYTPATRTDLADILEAIDRARVDGYSEVVGEHMAGTRDLAVPIRGEGGAILASLTTGERSEIFTDDRREPVLAYLRIAAATAERALCSVTPEARPQ
jgi:IclR family transcriptional regulator, pca regulon regulatory protein